MGVTRFPKGVSGRGGVELIGNTRSDITVGSVFWVDSGHADANDVLNWGTQKDQPFATLDYAVGRCTASSGDVIYLLPGHTETLTTADQIDLDVAGISVIGLGNGTDRPTFTYTVAAGEIVVGADNVLIENIVCNSSVTATLIAIDIEDGVDYCTIRNCQFGVDLEGTDEFNNTIVLKNNNTGCVIENNLIDMDIAGAVNGILLDADTARTVIRNNVILGDFSTANIFADTALSTDLLIQGNILVNGEGGDLGTEPNIELITNTTGIITDNYCVCNVASDDAAVVGDAMMNFNNQYSETVGAGVGIATAAGTTLTA
tara:strand:+ start:17121 stop:18068 length:948 start_codon:yes stop_codon:yes gene_type:complete